MHVNTETLIGRASVPPSAVMVVEVPVVVATVTLTPVPTVVVD